MDRKPPVIRNVAVNRRTGFTLLVLFNVAAFGVLGLYRTTIAGSPIGSPPFANTSESRLEMVQELKEIRDLLKEQNALLRSGEVKVIVTELPKQGEASKASTVKAEAAITITETAPVAEPAEEQK